MSGMYFCVSVLLVLQKLTLRRYISVCRECRWGGWWPLQLEVPAVRQRDPACSAFHFIGWLSVILLTTPHLHRWQCASICVPIRILLIGGFTPHTPHLGPCHLVTEEGGDHLEILGAINITIHNTMTKYEVIKSCRQSLWLLMYFYNIFISWTWENVCYLYGVKFLYFVMWWC